MERGTREKETRGQGKIGIKRKKGEKKEGMEKRS